MAGAVVLFLALWVPGSAPVAAAFPMPSAAVCRAASDQWLAGEPDPHAIRPAPSPARYALCVTLPATGRDA